MATFKFSGLTCQLTDSSGRFLAYGYIRHEVDVKEVCEIAVFKNILALG